MDSGALIALERGEGKVRALLELALRTRARVVVPAGVIAQVWRGGARQARLARFLCSPATAVDALDAEAARACGVLCGRAGTSDAIDASVVVSALRHRAVIVTSDAQDIRRLDAAVAVEAI
ncbi:MAG: PIN domain-containing protein [Myxococcales bacterium]|nr:PIN domain-containing protein [Myxococcales bacterium]